MLCLDELNYEMWHEMKVVVMIIQFGLRITLPETHIFSGNRPGPNWKFHLPTSHVQG